MKLAIAAVGGALVAVLVAVTAWFTILSDDEAATSETTCNDVNALMINAVERRYDRISLYNAAERVAEQAEEVGDLEVARILHDFAEARRLEDLGAAAVAIDQLVEHCPPLRDR